MAFLYYVVGPSGAGKDSILNAARPRLVAELSVVFAHRYITRPANAGGENHVALEVEDFQMRKARGLFCLDWESHGLCYGLGQEVRHWIENGNDVIMNGSRGYLPEANKRFGDALIPVSIEVDGAILRKRLVERARETAEEIDARVKRATAFQIEHPRLIKIENNGLLEHAVSDFCQHVKRNNDIVTVV
ncbi:MAG: phosphonate metabolism protein/1,5-bisphosphokinase (PRPP-forming) PhnN [Opitutales bacterium]